MTKKQRKHLIKKLAILESKGYPVPMFMDKSIDKQAIKLCDKFIWMKTHPNKKKLAQIAKW